MMTDSQTGDAPPVTGHLRLECRPVLSIVCPYCHREHARVLTAEDRLTLPGTHHWVQECTGRRFVVQIGAGGVASALRRAHHIAQLHRLSERWLKAEPE